MNKKYRVVLAPEQRQTLDALIHTGSASAHTQTHARILLKADGGADGAAWGDAAIALACDVSVPTVERVRRAFATNGLDAALQRKRWVGPPRRKLDGSQEAHLVALTCSPPPDGAERWTLALLADKLVTLNVVAAITPETVRRVLKNILDPMNWLLRRSRDRNRTGGFLMRRQTGIAQPFTLPA